jgi:hypothetical protein
VLLKPNNRCLGLFLYISLSDCCSCLIERMYLQVWKPRDFYFKVNRKWSIISSITSLITNHICTSWNKENFVRITSWFLVTFKIYTAMLKGKRRLTAHFVNTKTFAPMIMDAGIFWQFFWKFLFCSIIFISLIFSYILLTLFSDPSAKVFKHNSRNVNVSIEEVLFVFFSKFCHLVWSLQYVVIILPLVEVFKNKDTFFLYLQKKI